MPSAFRFTPLFIALTATIPFAAQADEDKADGFIEGSSFNPVSYTHLTLPTICSV